MQFEFKKSREDAKSREGERSLDGVLAKSIAYVKPDDTAWDAIQALAEQWADSVPVVENETLAGIVTARALIVDVAAKGADPKQIFVRDLMQPAIHCVSADNKTAAEEAQRIFHSTGLTRVFMVDEADRLVGALTRGDIERHLSLKTIRDADKRRNPPE